MTDQTILVTGGAGFIGSNLVEWLLRETTATVIVLDKLTYAADKKFIYGIDDDRFTLVPGDICDASLVREVFSKFAPTTVFHLAAESHVDNSIAGPEVFVDTNVKGTFQLLETARQNWMDDPHQFKEGMSHCRFLHVSTDEVYGSLTEDGFFTESTPYDPSSPYSASKAASDHLAKSYHRTYGLPVLVSNCSNNYGPRQHDEKLIPTIIRKALEDEPIPIYGQGNNVRDWLYVKDHCRALAMIVKNGRIGETYNVGGGNELQNIEVAKTVCNILDDISPRDDEKSYSQQINFVTDRPGHDFRYAIDFSKIESELDWRPQETFSTGISKTIAAYLKKYNA